MKKRMVVLVTVGIMASTAYAEQFTDPPTPEGCREVREYPGLTNQDFLDFNGVYACEKDIGKGENSYTECWKVGEDEELNKAQKKSLRKEGYRWLCTPY